MSRALNNTPQGRPSSASSWLADDLRGLCSIQLLHPRHPMTQRLGSSGGAGLEKGQNSQPPPLEKTTPARIRNLGPQPPPSEILKNMVKGKFGNSARCAWALKVLGPKRSWAQKVLGPKGPGPKKVLGPNGPGPNKVLGPKRSWPKRVLCPEGTRPKRCWAEKCPGPKWLTVWP